MLITLVAQMDRFFLLRRRIDRGGIIYGVLSRADNFGRRMER